MSAATDPESLSARQRRQRASRFWPWTDGEVRLAAIVLSPESLGTAAREQGDPVLGIPLALKEVARTLFCLRESALARAIRQGEDPARVRRELRAGLRVLGGGARWQPVEALTGPAPFRAIALAAWGDRPEPISDLREIPVYFDKGFPSPRALLRFQSIATLAVIESVQLCLAQAGPGLNRAILDGRVWGRSTPEVVVYHELAPDDIRPVVIDGRSPVREALAAGVRRAREASFHPLDPVGRWIVARWLRAGFLASPGGATVSSVGALWPGGGIHHPHGALLPGQGVPINVSIGAIDVSRCLLPVRITFDHRALDASAARYLHPRLHELVPAFMEEMLCSEASSSADRAGSVPRSLAG